MKKLFQTVLFLVSLNATAAVELDVNFNEFTNGTKHTVKQTVSVEFGKKTELTFGKSRYLFEMTVKDQTKRYPQTAVKALGRPILFSFDIYLVDGKKKQKVSSPQVMTFSGKSAEIEFSELSEGREESITLEVTAKKI